MTAPVETTKLMLETWSKVLAAPLAYSVALKRRLRSVGESRAIVNSPSSVLGPSPDRTVGRPIPVKAVIRPLTLAWIAAFIVVATESGMPDTTGFLKVTVQLESVADDVIVTDVTVGAVGTDVGVGGGVGVGVGVAVGVGVPPLADELALPQAATASATLNATPTRPGRRPQRLT